MMFCASTFAQDGISDRQREAVSLMNDLGIFEGIAEENAQDTVTRGNYAKIIVKVLGGENLSETPKRIYTDVLPENDAAASIEYLYNRGIMLGYDNAEFRPDSVITLEEAVKTIVSVMGYSKLAEQQGGYPDGYYKAAMNNGLLNGTTGERLQEVSFADTAVIISNLLESKNYQVVNGYKNGYPVIEQPGDKDYMGYTLDLYKYTGIVEACGDTALSDASTEMKEGTCKIGGEVFDCGSVDMMQYLGMKVRAYYKSDDYGAHILHITVDGANTVLDVSSDDISEKSTKTVFQYTENQKTKRVTISDTAIVIYNGKRLDVVADKDIISVNGDVRLISNDGDGKYDVIIVREYETFIVDKAVATDSLLTFKYGKGSLDLEEGGGIRAKYYTDGAETDFSSITGGSVVSVAISRNKSGDVLAEVLISNNKVTGTALNYENNGAKSKVVLEDGSEYTLTYDYINRLDEGQSETYAPMLGSEGEFYIDSFNKLAAYKMSSGGKNYAYIVKCWFDPNEQKGYIRLFTKDAEFKTLVFAEKMRFNSSRPENQETIPEMLKQTGEDNTIHQLVVYKSNENDEVIELNTAENKMNDLYYISKDEEFTLHAHPKNKVGQAAGLRFYKNMAVGYPFAFVDGKTIQFMIPTNKTDEKAYRIATKISSTDESLPAPVYIYDAGAAGNIGAITTNTSSEGSLSTPFIIDNVVKMVDEDDMVCTGLEFFGGSSVIVSPDVEYTQPKTNWSTRVDYSGVTVDDLKRGDVIEYTTSDNQVNQIRVIVKADNVGPTRIDGGSAGADMQRNGNTVADIISVAENGRTALVNYFDADGTERYQTLLINGTVYRYESAEKQVYNSSTSDLRPGDRVLINAFWWSPKVVVIFR